MNPAGALHIHLLGYFSLTCDAQPLTAFDQPRLQALTAFLVLRSGVPQERQQMACHFWPDTTDAQARSNLRTLLHRLRGALPDADRFLRFDQHHVEWRGDGPFHLDAADFEAALGVAHDSKALQAAVDLYSGDLLPTCYDEWIMRPRERLRQMFLQSLQRLAAEYEAGRQFDPALRCAERLLTADPVMEANHRRLMHLHLANNDRAAALHAYHRCAALLRRELNVDPHPRTQALYQRVLEQAAGDPDQDTAPLPSLSPLSTPRLVGRQAEWAQLLERWQAAAAGSPGLVLLSGEAGVGTTRLAEELVAWLWRRGRDVAVARCDPSVQPLPFAPVAAWLRSPCLQARLSALDDGRLAEIARLLPEVLTSRPGLTAPGPLLEAWQRRRFFEALAAPLLNPPRPLLLLADDLHLGDEQTLAWLHYLLSQAGRAPLLVLGTVRREEIQADHPLHDLRRRLQASGRWHELTLAPLNVHECGELAAQLAGRPLTPCEIRHLHHDSEGNPLFLVETVRAGSMTAPGAQPNPDPDPAGPLCPLCPLHIRQPLKVQAVLEQRLAQLSAAGRSLAQVAAVLGRQCTLDALRRVSGLDEAGLLTTLDELWRRGIVRQQGADGYDFSHDKLRAAAYTQLSAPQRRLLHRRAGQALQEAAPAPVNRAAQAAHHFEEAGEAAAAVTWWLQAGDEARSVAAVLEADACYRRAAALLHAQGDTAGAGQAMLRLGQTHHTAFDFSAASAAYATGFGLLAQQPAWSAVAAPHAALHLARLIPQTLDPAADDGRDAWLIDQLFCGLVAEGPDMTIVPDIAADWQVEAAGRVYTFRLRRDVAWSDGAPVTAGDFAFAWRRALDPATAAPFARLLGDIAGAAALLAGETIQSDQLGVQVLDPFTLRVTLAEPVNSFLYVLAHRVAFAVPRHALAQHGRAWSAPAHLVSNGPFRLAAWQQGKALTLERNADYHAPATGRLAGNVGRVEVTLLTDWEEQAPLYEAGQLDVLALHRLPRTKAVHLHRRHTGEFSSVPDLRVDYLAFDTRRPPFDDARVRRAFVLATDRAHLAAARLFGYDSPATGGFIPPNLPGHAADTALPYAPGQAQQLLAAAGYPGGQGLPLIELWGGESSSVWASVSEYLAQQWQEVLGVRSQVRSVEAGQVIRFAGVGGPHILFVGWRADFPDPDNFLRLAPISLQTGWRHAAYDDLVARARTERDAVERLRLY
ncbi:MAG: ABC transporter substrate-binding protein, partial [Anaerolineae bacterium]